MTIKKNKYKAQSLDPLRTLFAAYASKNVKEDLYKLIIINGDFSSILEKAREPMQALARLQFWQIQLEKIHRKEAPDTVEAKDLYQLVKQYKLDTQMLQQWLLIRQKDYTHLPHKDAAELDRYLTQTSGNFMVFWGNIVHSDHKNHQDLQQLQAIGHLWGLVGIMRSIAFHAHLNLCHLPQDLLYNHGLLLADHWRASPKDNIAPVVEKIASYAYIQLDQLQNQDLRKVDKSIHLHLIVARSLLKHMKALDFDPFHPSWEAIPKTTYLKILTKGVFG